MAEKRTLPPLSSFFKPAQPISDADPALANMPLSQPLSLPLSCLSPSPHSDCYRRGVLLFDQRGVASTPRSRRQRLQAWLDDGAADSGQHSGACLCHCSLACLCCCSSACLCCFSSACLCISTFNSRAFRCICCSCCCSCCCSYA